MEMAMKTKKTLVKSIKLYECSKCQLKTTDPYYIKVRKEKHIICRNCHERHVQKDTGEDYRVNGQKLFWNSEE